MAQYSGASKPAPFLANFDDINIPDNNQTNNQPIAEKNESFSSIGSPNSSKEEARAKLEENAVLSDVSSLTTPTAINHDAPPLDEKYLPNIENMEKIVEAEKTDVLVAKGMTSVKQDPQSSQRKTSSAKKMANLSSNASRSSDFFPVGMDENIVQKSPKRKTLRSISPSKDYKKSPLFPPKTPRKPDIKSAKSVYAELFKSTPRSAKSSIPKTPKTNNIAPISSAPTRTLQTKQQTINRTSSAPRQTFATKKPISVSARTPTNISKPVQKCYLNGQKFSSNEIEAEVNKKRAELTAIHSEKIEMARIEYVEKLNVLKEKKESIVQRLNGKRKEINNFADLDDKIKQSNKNIADYDSKVEAKKSELIKKLEEKTVQLDLIINQVMRVKEERNFKDGDRSTALKSESKKIMALSSILNSKQAEMDSLQLKYDDQMALQIEKRETALKKAQEEMELKIKTKFEEANNKTENLIKQIMWKKDKLEKVRIESIRANSAMLIAEDRLKKAQEMATVPSRLSYSGHSSSSQGPEFETEYEKERIQYEDMSNKLVFDTEKREALLKERKILEDKANFTLKLNESIAKDRDEYAILAKQFVEDLEKHGVI